MFTFFLQGKDLITEGKIHAFFIFVVYVWALWFYKRHVSKKYKPYTEPVDIGVSVIIPVVDEPSEVFTDVLRRINKQNPEELLVVINGKRNISLEAICEKQGVSYMWTSIPGKRNALKVGFEATTQPVVVLVDSDTLWEPNTLEELKKPFADESVGGVTTRQHIMHEERNLMTRWASWIEEVRNRYSMPAMSVYGQVGCLPGRTIAFRESVLLEAMDDFMNEEFLGVKLEVSDDRSLTNYCLKQGYKTVMQSTSNVWTDAPTEWSKLMKQQLRWARGSQYNTARMAGWMAKNSKFLFLLYISDIIIPFFLIGILFAWILQVAVGGGSDMYGFLDFSGTVNTTLIVGSILFGTVISFSSRQTWGLKRYGKWLIPFILINTFILVPIRVRGFFGMAKNASWGTRKDSFEGESKPSPQAYIPMFAGCSILFLFTFMSFFLG